MPEKLKEFFEEEEKHLNQKIEEMKKEKEELGTEIHIGFEHYWGRRAELKYIRNQLEELFKEEDKIIPGGWTSM